MHITTAYPAHTTLGYSIISTSTRRCVSAWHNADSPNRKRLGTTPALLSDALGLTLLAKRSG